MNVGRVARMGRLAPIVTLCALPPLYIAAFFEAAYEGPWTRAYNHRLDARARSASLIGQSESAVEKTLGRASVITRYPDGKTFNYQPWPGIPISQFQVHTQDGVVTGLELFD